MMCAITVFKCGDQTRPVSMSEAQIQATDGFLFHHIKTTVVPRFLCLSKADLRTCIAAYVPTKAGGLPPDITMQQVVHVAAALIDDYYKCAVQVDRKSTRLNSSH